MTDQITRRSLLLRVRDAADATAWQEFEHRYRELIVRYARVRGLQEADADDIAQLVFAKLARSLRTFAYDPSKGQFRGYLYQIVKNEIIRQFARPNRPKQCVDIHDAAATADEDETRLARLWQHEWENHHVRMALLAVRESCDQKSVRVFERLLQGATVPEAADEFGMSPEAVHKVKQRMRARLEEQIARQVAEEDHPEGLSPAE